MYAFFSNDEFLIVKNTLDSIWQTLNITRSLRLETRTNTFITTGYGKVYRREVVFLIKIENFYQKNNFPPKKIFPHAFERSEKQCVVRPIQ